MPGATNAYPSQQNPPQPATSSQGGLTPATGGFRPATGGVQAGHGRVQAGQLQLVTRPPVMTTRPAGRDESAQIVYDPAGRPG